MNLQTNHKLERFRSPHDTLCHSSIDRLKKHLQCEKLLGLAGGTTKKRGNKKSVESITPIIGRPRKRRVVECDICMSNHLEAVRVFEHYESEVARYWNEASISVNCHRSTYSEADCKRMLEFLKLPGASVHEASKKFNTPKSTVQDMKKRQFPDTHTQTIKRSEPCSQRGRNKSGAGRPLAYNKSIDESIMTWILEMRDLHLPVSCQDVRNKAAELVTPHNPTFKASSGWLSKYFKRHHLTLRARTSIAQKLPPQLEEKVDSTE